MHLQAHAGQIKLERCEVRVEAGLVCVMVLGT